MILQAGIASKWTNDSQRFLLEHFDTICNSPSHIYHSALPFSPSSSWFQQYYTAELSLTVKVVQGLPGEWGMCSRTVLLDSPIRTLSYHDNTIAVGCKSGDIIILDAITGSQRAILSGHKDCVTSVTFSSDGASLVSGSDCHRGRPLVGFPWSKPSTQMSMVSLFGMVPAGLEPSTGLLSLVGHLGVVSWSKG